METKYSVGQYLVDRLTQLGLSHLFSIAGDYTIQWVNNFVEPSSIEVIEEVNELNATFAADGYSRVAGLSATCFTYSAGTLSAVNAIAGAYVERVPIILINGSPNINQRLTFEQTGFTAHHLIKGNTDLKVYENITVAAVKIDNPDLAPMLIDYALTKCISEKRPVYIELLDDMVYKECATPQGELKPAKTYSDENNLAQAIKTIQERLESATNPMIWVGPEVDRFDLNEKAQELIQNLNIPFVTELLSKAILSENSHLFAGVYDGQASSPATQVLVEKSDFVLALGVWLTDINSLGEGVDYDKTALISFDTLKLGTIFIPQIGLADFINGIIATEISCKSQAVEMKTLATAGVDASDEISYQGSHEIHKEQYASGQSFVETAQVDELPNIDLSDEITYQGFYDFIQTQQYVTNKTLVGSDASLNYFGNILLKVGAPKGFVSQSFYSAIGYIAPAATGMSLAKEDDQRVIVFTGDGGFQMCAQCLSTQTRFGLNPIIFIMDNGVYGVEQWLYDASIFTTDKPFFDSCKLHRWNYSELSKVFGCKGWKTNTYRELKQAVEEALENTDSPSIIQVIIPEKSIPDNAKWKKN